MTFGFITSQIKHHITDQASHHISSITSHIKHHITYQASHHISSITSQIKHHITYQASHHISSITSQIKHHITDQASHHITYLCNEMHLHVSRTLHLPFFLLGMVLLCICRKVFSFQNKVSSDGKGMSFIVLRMCRAGLVMYGSTTNSCSSAGKVAFSFLITFV